MQTVNLQTLLQTNLEWLDQATSLLSALSDAEYAHAAAAHLRHVLEFYASFAAGMESGYIDYDARPRDRYLERSRTAALQRLSALSNLLISYSHTLKDRTLSVRIEDADPDSEQNCWLGSSIGRELQALSSHTVHHFALIAVGLHAQGVTVPEDFGYSPATLRYRSQAA